MFSVIIPSLHAPLIGAVIAALRAQTAADLVREIIVVGQDRFGKVPADVRFEQTTRPLSAAAARNQGAALASAAYLLFIDADCLAVPGLVAALAARHRQGHSVVGGAVAVERRPYWVLCDNLLVFADVLAESPAGPRPFVPSLIVSIQRTAFEQAGGFDERYPGAAGEDYDLCLRLRDAGHQPFFEPRAAVVHRPARASAALVFNHLRAFGRAQVTLARRYGLRAGSRPGPALRQVAPLLLAAGAPLACWHALALYCARPELRRYPAALPGIAWARLGWLWGVSEGLLVAA